MLLSTLKPKVNRVTNVIKFRQINLMKLIQHNSFWLALILHLLLLFAVTIVLVAPQKRELRPDLTIPSYVYQQAAKTEVAQEPSEAQPVQKKGGIEKPQPQTPTPTPQSEQSQPEQPRVMSISKPTEPVHLIGDKNIEAPLLTLLGKALTRKLIYPKIAIDFNIRGTAVIGFLLQPDGTVIAAQLVRSSGAGVLDAEAIRAVYAISPVKHVDTYLKEPRYLLIGIIFG